jgi:hypothetical protein
MSPAAAGEPRTLGGPDDRQAEFLAGFRRPMATIEFLASNRTCPNVCLLCLLA